MGQGYRAVGEPYTHHSLLDAGPVDKPMTPHAGLMTDAVALSFGQFHLEAAGASKDPCGQVDIQTVLGHA